MSRNALQNRQSATHGRQSATGKLQSVGARPRPGRTGRGARLGVRRLQVAAAVALLAFATSCGETVLDCEPGTLFVEIELNNDALPSPALRVGLGTNQRGSRVTVIDKEADERSGSVAFDFGEAYPPAGTKLTVRVEALSRRPALDNSSAMGLVKQRHTEMIELEEGCTWVDFVFPDS